MAIIALLLSSGVAVAQRGGPQPQYSGYMNFSGTISPSIMDLDLRELLFYETDGTTYITVAGPLTGTCAAGTTCSFGASIGYNGPPNYVPTSVSYSIMGFYGSGGVYGPTAADLDVSGNVVSNPKVFAVASTGFATNPPQAFEVFFPVNFGSQTAENGVATTFYRGGFLVADGVSYQSLLNFQQVAVGGPLTGGNILDFSNGTLNGSVSISTVVTSSPVPEPSTMLLLGAGVALAAAWRIRRSPLTR